MKLLKTNRSEGYAKILIENTDDLWHLKEFITPRSRLKAMTQRTKLDGREKKQLHWSLKQKK